MNKKKAIQITVIVLSVILISAVVISLAVRNNSKKPKAVPIRFPHLQPKIR